jgi:cholesterol oxidase
VRLRAHPEIFDRKGWPGSVNRKVLDPYYDLAGDILKAEPCQPNPVLGLPTRSEAFIAAAKNCTRCQREPHLVPIAVLTSQEPVQTPAGVPQTPCVYCGECLIGCPPPASFKGNVNARALLTLNYLALAQQHKAQIFPEHRVDRVRKVAGGFEVDVTLRGEGPPNPHGSLRAKQVVLAAGTLGSTEVLLKSQKTLPPMSKKLGQQFSGNGDFLGAQDERYGAGSSAEERAVDYGGSGLQHRGSQDIHRRPRKDSFYGSGLWNEEGQRPYQETV